MSNGQQPEQVHLLDLWRTLWSYRIAIASITAVMCALSVVFALVAPPKYRAEVVLSEVQDRAMGGGGLAGQLGGFASLVGVNLGGFGSSTRESLAVLSSRALAEEFIRRNKLLPVLFEDPDPKTPPSVWRGALLLREGILEIQQDPRTLLVTVAVTWKDPRIAADWANGYAALANEMLRTRALRNAESSIDYLRKLVQKTDVVELRSVMYKLIESETKKLMLANVQEEYAFVVVDPAAASEFRHTPKRTLIVVFGTLFGGFLGLMYAFVHDLLRREWLRGPERGAGRA